MLCRFVLSIQPFVRIPCVKDGITLQQMLEVGILDHIDTLERISVKATLLGFKSCWLVEHCSCELMKSSAAFQAQKEHELKTALTMMKKEPEPFCLAMDLEQAMIHW